MYLENDFEAIRGFNYQPGYAGSLQMVWTAFDREVWEREIAWSKRFRTNMLRVWLDWHAWIAIGDKLFDHLETALAIAEKNGIRLMPVLFNRWNDCRLPMGMVCERDLQGNYGFSAFRPYVEGLMRRFGTDPRVAIWDLCNEPQAPGMAAEQNFREAVWLSHIAQWVRENSDRPITIGTMTNDFVRIYAPLVDVISFHPYTVKPDEMDQFCSDHLAIAADYRKPLLCTECCKGSFDDRERGEQARRDVESMQRHRVGWLLWQLVESRFITGSKERADGNSMHPNQGYMPFILKDGTTRPGHEWLENI